MKGFSCTQAYSSLFRYCVFGIIGKIFYRVVTVIRIFCVAIQTFSRCRVSMERALFFEADILRNDEFFRLLPFAYEGASKAVSGIIVLAAAGRAALSAVWRFLLAVASAA